MEHWNCNINIGSNRNAEKEKMDDTTGCMLLGSISLQMYISNKVSLYIPT